MYQIKKAINTLKKAFFESLWVPAIFSIMLLLAYPCELRTDTCGRMEQGLFHDVADLEQESQVIEIARTKVCPGCEGSGTGERRNYGVCHHVGTLLIYRQGLLGNEQVQSESMIIVPPYRKTTPR